MMTPTRTRRHCAARLTLGLALLLPTAFVPHMLPAVELWHGPKDSFPVFNDPVPLSAEQAEADGVVHPRDMVIGIALGGTARAYPLQVMGVHELGNDMLGDTPIAISW